MKPHPDSFTRMGQVLANARRSLGVIRFTAAPKSTVAEDMYDALCAAEGAVEQLCQGQDQHNECWNTLSKIRSALARARGEV